ncbi:MAG: ribonuclease D, partial [Eggerthellaceae bacterium]|nr:ribonuclease D [Eggerthellaceae bacterium]
KPHFTNADLVKLFQAGGQDIEIISSEVGVVPQPLFDTQIAAALLGHTLQVGYGSLVQSVCGVTLKKGDSFTDWSRRPLSPSQLQYAADDVIYLPKLYRKMSARLGALGRLSWLDADFAELGDPKRYETDPRARYLKLKRVNQLSRRQLSAAREVAAWREHRAMERNVPRKWIMTDEQIVEACRRGARTIDQLFMVRGMSEKLTTKDARAVCAVMTRGLDLPSDQWPVNAHSSYNEANVDAEADAMSAIVRLRSKEHDIAFQALASHADLVKVARGHDDTEVLHGWRREIVGNDLLSFMRGDLVISVQNGSVKVTNRE